MAVQQPKTRPVRNCIFCALRRAKSAEHGWSNWAIQRFATAANRIAGQVDGMPFFDKTQKSVTVRCVCVPCNTGWMKDLEDEIIKTVGKMAEGKPSTLTVLEQWTIARWAVAKAMVWEYSTREHPIFYTQEDRTAVMNDGLPPNTVVWLAVHLGRETFYTAAARCSSIDPNHHLQLEGLFTTSTYNRLVLQVMTVRPYDHPDPYSRINCDQTAWSDAIIRIWPTTSPVVWPPLLALDDDMLETFHTRCGEARIAKDGTVQPIKRQPPNIR